ncbi:MAG: hypothetical protein AAF226_09935, partial [Verrucomicrobiota bacterium]
VVGLVGFYGQSQPQQWLVLVKDARVEDMMHEFVISDSKVRAQRHFRKLPNQDLPSIPISIDQVKIDSSKAFQIVEQLAGNVGIGFDTVHYQLRARDLRSEAVWMLNLIDRNQNSVGVHYISAETGQVLRSVWQKPEGKKVTSTDTPAEIQRTASRRPTRLGKAIQEVRNLSGRAQ